MTLRFRVWHMVPWLVLVSSVLSAVALAQWSPDVQGLKNFQMRLGDGNVQFNVETQSDQRTSHGEATRFDYVFLEPSVGFDLRGSIYHPNLLEFLISPEFGYSWQMMRQNPPGNHRWSASLLQRYNARFDVLREKPYATNLFAERGRSYRDLDFFSRARVDSARFGAHTGYCAGQVPFTFDAMHLAETVTGSQGRGDTDVSDNTFTFSIRHVDRKDHKASFSYVLNTYSRLEAGFAPATGTAQTANLSDTISWGRDEWISLGSTGLFNHLKSNTSLTRSLAVQEDLGLKFRPDLSGDCYWNFGDQRSDNVSNRSQEARATVQHQLYKSLTSWFTVQWASLAMRSQDTSMTEGRVGVSLAENYTKELPAHSHLSISTNWQADRHQRKTAGQMLRVANEALVLRDSKPSFLSQTNIVTVDRVTNALGVAYVVTLDYVLVPHGAVMEVRRVPGGNISDGGNVLVDYTATAPPTDSYSTATQYYSVRLDLFDRRLAIYGRINQIDNVGGESLVLRNLADRAIGVEIPMRWLTIGGERDRQNSNLAPFYSQRLYQSCAFDLGVGSTLTLDAEESWAKFPDSGLTRQSRGFIGRYQWQLNSFLSCQLEGGLHRERGQGVDQDRKVARAALNFTYGRLLLNLSYDFEDENLVGELHRRQHVTLRIKRLF